MHTSGWFFVAIVGTCACTSSSPSGGATVRHADPPAPCTRTVELPTRIDAYPASIELRPVDEAAKEGFRQRTGVEWSELYMNALGHIGGATVDVADRDAAREIVDSLHGGRAFGLSSHPDARFTVCDEDFSTLRLVHGGRVVADLHASWHASGPHWRVTVTGPPVPPKALGPALSDSELSRQIDPVEVELRLEVPPAESFNYRCDCEPGPRGCDACSQGSRAMAAREKEAKEAREAAGDGVGVHRRVARSFLARRRWVAVTDGDANRVELRHLAGPFQVDERSLVPPELLKFYDNGSLRAIAMVVNDRSDHPLRTTMFDAVSGHPYPEPACSGSLENSAIALCTRTSSQ